MKGLQWGDVYLNKKTGLITKYQPLHKGQEDCFNTAAKIVAAIGGVRSGKSTIGGVLLAREIESNGGRGKYLVVAPTYGVGLTSTLDVWETVVKGTSLKGKFYRDNARPYYKCGTGAIVYFASADSDFEGLSPQAVWLDEAGNVSESVFFKLHRRLTGTAGRIFLTTTPYPKYDWIWRVVCNEADKGNPLYFYRCFPTELNPWAARDKASIEEARRLMPAWEFEMMYEGKYTRPPGLVYDFVDADGNSCFVDIPPGGLPEAAGFFAGYDPGGTDPTCCLVSLLDTKGCLWVFWEHYKTNEDILQTLEKLTEWHEAFRKSTGTEVARWYCDHRPEIIRSLRRLGLNAKPARKGPESIPLGISLVQARIRTGKLKIIRQQCPNVKAESMNYRYPMADDGLAVGNKPIDKDNHAMDALRYIVLGLDRKAGKSLLREYIGYANER